MSLFLRSAVCLTLTSLTVSRLRADEGQISVGDVGPTWQNLTGTDDKKHSLSDLASFDAIVVVFTCNSCPYSVDYEDRLIQLKKKYLESGAKVQVVAINANTIEADNLNSMKERANQKSFNFPYLWDETQQTAKNYGAVYTPEFFVLNRERRIVYKGAMDDSTKAQNVDQKFVELAVTAALSGKTPEVTRTGARGCAIRFNRKRR